MGNKRPISDGAQIGKTVSEAQEPSKKEGLALYVFETEGTKGSKGSRGICRGRIELHLIRLLCAPGTNSFVLCSRMRP